MPGQNSAGCLCRDHERVTFDRPELFVPLVLIMFASFGLMLAFSDLPYGVQLGSLIPYTAWVFLVTFSAQRGQQPYFFACPIAHQTLHTLIRRHWLYLIALVSLQTIAFRVARYLPSSWLVAHGREGSPFAITLCILCLCLGFVQVLSNRSLLKRTHREKNVLL